MIITFERPLFATGNPIPITVNGTEAGSMKRWFKPREERSSRDPGHEVNIAIQTGGKRFGITQVRTSFKEGTEWEVSENDEVLTHISSPEGLKQKHRIETAIEGEIPVAIEAIWQRKGLLMINGSEAGQTEARGFLFNSRYVVEIRESLPDALDPALLAGMVYAFWCSF